MTFDYHTYLASREWAKRREAVRKRCLGICERCHRAPMQGTHHKTYANVGAEPLEDLQGLCNPCHAFLSAKSDRDPLVTFTDSLPPRQRSEEAIKLRARLVPGIPHEEAIGILRQIQELG